MVKKYTLHAIKAIDRLIAAANLKLTGDSDAVISILLHGLYDKQLASGVDNQLFVSTEQLRTCIEYYLKNGYRFLTPKEIQSDSPQALKGVFLTFDDGYFNNTLALPILNEYSVPATFLISTNFVKEEKNFWWDVLYSQMHRQGASLEKIFAARKQMKVKRFDEIEKDIRRMFGEKPLYQKEDITRPFTQQELSEFAKDALITIGNHTADHAILTNLSQQDEKKQITDAQDYLQQSVGHVPNVFAYPNGKYTPQTISVLEESGLTLAITTHPHKNLVPISRGSKMELGRFTLLGNKSIQKQCESYRYNIPSLIEQKSRRVYIRI